MYTLKTPATYQSLTKVHEFGADPPGMTPGSEDCIFEKKK